MQSLRPFEARLADAWPPSLWQEVTVLLAVSGGADSIALLRGMLALKPPSAGRLVVAHLNHQLRADQSDADAAFVGDLARKLGVPCELGWASIGHALGEAGNGLEAAAREARYQFLGQTAARLGARYVVTAHTADDQAETILHHVIRGTGIGGLGGMARARPLLLPAIVADEEDAEKNGMHLVSGRGDETASPFAPATLMRPLLKFRRAELIAYLEDLGQPYRHDSSNDDLGFTRNRIRHRLLPQLTEQFNAGVVDALLRLGALAAEVQEVVDALVGGLFQQSVTIESPEAARINAHLHAGQHRYLVRALLMRLWRVEAWPMRSMGFAQWELLADMLFAAGDNSSASPPKQMFPGNVLAEASPGVLRLVRSTQRVAPVL